MKTFARLSISAALLTGSLAATQIAFGQEATQFDFNALPSRLTRAEVVEQVLEARANGTLPRGGEVTEFAYNAESSTLTRAQVVAEAIEAKRLGLVGHGALNPRVATAAEQRLIVEAGLRAIERQAVSQR